jgi:superfamily II DNA helicase RecQ
MDGQVLYLNNLCIPAIAITNDNDPEIIQQVLNGYYIVVFGSPECLLSASTWRGLFMSELIKEMIIGVAIDEAHCITQWYVNELSFNIMLINHYISVFVTELL